jgi:hypothetical protein
MTMILISALIITNNINMSSNDANALNGDIQSNYYMRKMIENIKSINWTQPFVSIYALGVQTGVMISIIWPVIPMLVILDVILHRRLKN